MYLVKLKNYYKLVTQKDLTSRMIFKEIADKHLEIIDYVIKNNTVATGHGETLYLYSLEAYDQHNFFKTYNKNYDYRTFYTEEIEIYKNNL